MKEFLTIAVACFLWSTQAESHKAVPFLPQYGEVLPTPAAKELCESFPHECEPLKTMPRTMKYTIERRRELERINNDVNTHMKYITDKELYEVDEKWTVDNIQGDCEEFASRKRRLLIAKGWPPETLSVTVVQKRDGFMHAVLTARMSIGDLILDRPPDKGPTLVWWWHEMPYTYVAQQSFLNPQKWMSLVQLPLKKQDGRITYWVGSK